MPRAVTAGYRLHLDEEVVQLATLWRVTRLDSTVFLFTDHDRNITVDPDDPVGDVSPVTFLADSGYTRSAIKASAALNIDNLTIQSHVDGGLVTDEDVRAGRWDFAEVEMWLVIWSDPKIGLMALPRGKLGKVDLKDRIYVAEFRGLHQLLQDTIGEVTTPQCRADLGDIRCQFVIEPADWVTLTLYGIGEAVNASVYDARRYQVDVASDGGTSGVSEPAFDTTIGNTTVDATVTWTTHEAVLYESSVVAFDANDILAADIGDSPNDMPLARTDAKRFVGGLLKFTSGFNQGIGIEVRSWDYDTAVLTATMAGGPDITFANSAVTDPTLLRSAGSWITDGFVTGMLIDTANASQGANNGRFLMTNVTATVITLDDQHPLVNEGPTAGVTVSGDTKVRRLNPLFKFPFTPAPGDTFTVYAGCQKRSAEDCRDKFDNIINFRGEPFVPGVDQMTRHPDAPS